MSRFDRAASNDSRQRRALGALARAGLVHEHAGNETPAGAVDGANVTFTLASIPRASSLRLYKNGLLMSQGATDDYTLSGGTITFAADQIPQTGDKMRAWYIKA